MDSIGGLHTKSLCPFSCFGMDGAAHWEFGFGLNPMYNKARGCISGYILDSAHALVLNLFFSFISICFFLKAPLVEVTGCLFSIFRLFVDFSRSSPVHNRKRLKGTEASGLRNPTTKKVHHRGKAGSRRKRKKEKRRLLIRLLDLEAASTLSSKEPP